MKKFILYIIIIAAHLFSQTENALSFDGTDDYVNISGEVTSVTTTQPITVEAWIYPVTNADVRIIASKYYGGAALASNFNITRDTEQKLLLSGNGTNVLFSNAVIPIDTWTHIAVVFQSGTSNTQIYINGVLDQTGTLYYNNTNSETEMRIGEFVNIDGSTVYQRWNGVIDEVRVSDAVRTQTQISDNMNIPLAGTETGLVAYYGFNHGTANGDNAGITTLSDLTVNTWDGTLQNFALSGTTSNWVEGVLDLDPPSAPEAAAATNITFSKFTANWNPVTSATGYYLDVATDNGFSSFLTGYEGKNVLNAVSFTVNELSPETEYFYRVRAYNGGGESQNSNTISAQTLIFIPPEPPLAAQATNVIPGSFSANWESSAGADGYYFDLARDLSFTDFVPGYQSLDVGDVLTLSIGDLEGGTYFYRVKAYYYGGETAFSNTISVEVQSTLQMGLIEDIYTVEPYPVGKLVRINSDGDILAVNSAYRQVHHLESGSNEWGNNLNVSSNITDMYFGPDNTALVGTQSHGMYMSQPGSGYSWNQILSDCTVFSMGILTDGTILAGTTDGLYRSTNDGVSWSIVYDYPLKMRINESNSTIYIEEYNRGLCKSTDNGFTWEEINYNLSKDITINDIQVAANGTVFISVLDNGLYRLDGSTWITQQFNYTNVPSLHAGKDGYMYCSLGDKIYRKTVTQSFWPVVKDSLGAVTSFDSNSGKIIAGYTDDMLIFESVDSGITWTENGQVIYPTVRSIFALRNYIVIGTEDGLWNSTDYGSTWSHCMDGIQVYSIELGKYERISIGTNDGLYRSSDHGQTWVKRTTCPLNVVNEVLFEDDIFYIGGEYKLYRSNDLGSTWSIVPIDYDNYPEPFGLLKTDTGRIYTSDPHEGIWYTDNESIWTYTGFDNSYCIEKNQDGDIFAHGSYSLIVLRYGSEVWEASESGNYYDISVSSDNIVLVSGSGSFIYGFNGDSWTTVSDGLPSGIVVNAIAKDDNGYIYCGMGSAKGVYRSNITVLVP
ncbi:MAG: fibronectin type III domain-containing protein [Candidatus Delongbacteria bacterium]|nr:fibronectin type III domain-containing protein [Candidatus Delongbacteria bacterium]